MSWIDRILGRETRSAARQSIGARDPYLAEFFGVGPGSATPDAVLSNSAVAARCIALKSGLLASVPLHLFRRDEGGRERANDQPLYGVLHDLANPQQTAFEFRELMIRRLDLHGNAFALIERNARGQVTALWPLAHTQVAVERLPNGRLRYRVSGADGGTRVHLQEEVLHVRGPSRDGIMGQSPIQIARATLSLGIAQAETAQALMANSLRPSGVLSFPGQVTADQREQIRGGIAARYLGANSGNVLIMDGGAKFERITFSPEDAEFLASRKLANEDVARVFDVPPTAVGILDKGTYSNVEQEGRALVQNCLGPLAARLEAALSRCLLTDAGRRTYYVEHDLSGLLRGDTQGRFEAYRIGREIGVFSPNDIRRRENEPPVEGGDVYHQPANWVRLGSGTQPPESGVGG